MTKLNAILYGAALLLAGLSFAVWQANIATPASPQPAQADTGATSDLTVTTPPVPSNKAQHARIDARPLFIANRQPLPPDPADNPPPASGSSFTLVGILANAGKELAVLRRDNDHDVITLAPGQAIDGWTLIEITNRSVSLQAGENRLALRLADDKSAGPQ